MYSLLYYVIEINMSHFINKLYLELTQQGE